MTTFFTHMTGHLGDNLWHLNYLRRQAQRYPEHRFVHAARFDYLSQLVEVVCDLSNITLTSLDFKPKESLNAWINHEKFHDNHPQYGDLVGVIIDRSRKISEEWGLEMPFQTRKDFLFDYPALRFLKVLPFDVLVINARPLSGQFKGYSEAGFEDLVQTLINNGLSVVTTSRSRLKVRCTQDDGLSVSLIGGMSLFCKCIIGVSSGPIWPTFNVWNQDSVKLRMVLHDNRDRIDYDDLGVLDVRSFDHAKAIFREHGLVRR